MAHTSDEYASFSKDDFHLGQGIRTAAIERIKMTPICVGYNLISVLIKTEY